MKFKNWGGLKCDGAYFPKYRVISLPDISLWDTQNVTNMSSMFCNCYLLSYLPDISKWDTKNVNNISNMFFGCDSLKNIPKKYLNDKFK